MGTILDQYGSPPPPPMKHDLETVAKIPKGVLGKVLAYAKEIILDARDVDEQGLETIAKEFGLEKFDLTGTIRVFGNLISPFMSEPSAEKFQEELVALGLDAEHARIVKDALLASKDQLKILTKDSFRERFGPVLSEVRWRLDRVVSSSEPVEIAPIGVVSFTLETAHNRTDRTFEIDLDGLDKVLERLTALRRELTKATKGGSK